MTRCSVHPRYRALRKPRSVKDNCTCREIWAFAEYLRKTAAEVAKWPQWMRDGVGPR
jgi:hypothetical protein